MISYEYNGVKLANCNATEFSAKEEFGPQWGLVTRYAIRVCGFVLCSGRSVSEIRSLLEAPRKDLKYVVAGVTVLDTADLEWPHYIEVSSPTVVCEAAEGVFQVECGCVLRVDLEEPTTPIIRGVA